MAEDFTSLLKVVGVWLILVVLWPLPFPLALPKRIWQALKLFRLPSLIELFSTLYRSLSTENNQGFGVYVPLCLMILGLPSVLLAPYLGGFFACLSGLVLFGIFWWVIENISFRKVSQDEQELNREYFRGNITWDELEDSTSVLVAEERTVAQKMKLEQDLERMNMERAKELAKKYNANVGLFILPNRPLKWVGFLAYLTIGLLACFVCIRGILMAETPEIFREISGFLIIPALVAGVCFFISGLYLDAEEEAIREIRFATSGTLAEARLIGKEGKVDPFSWIKKPSPGFENNANPYEADQDGLIFEHPNVIGLTIGNGGSIKTIIVGLCIYSLGLPIALIAPEGAYTLIIITLIWLIIEFRRLFQSQQYRDTPCSSVSSMAVGPVFLTGQVRKLTKTNLYGDEPPAGANVSGMVTWFISKESKNSIIGKTNSWRPTGKFFLGGMDFIIHDGSGGVQVNPSTFKNFQFNRNTRRVTRYSSIDENNRFLIRGIVIGEPLTIKGTAIIKPQSKAKESDSNIQSSLLQVISGDEVGWFPEVRSGTSLTCGFFSANSTDSVLLPLVIFFAHLITLLAWINV